MDSFSSATTSQEKIVHLLEPGIDPSKFWVAIDPASHEVVGTVGVADESGYPLRVVKGAVQEALGRFKAFFVVPVLEDEFTIPRTFTPGQAYLNFVGVRAVARGERLASRLMQAVLDTNEYDVYTLDVVQGNERVLPIYESLGFVEVGRPKEERGWMKGFTFRYMLEYKR